MEENNFKKLKSELAEFLNSQGATQLDEGSSETSMLGDMDVLALTIDGVAVMLTHCAPIQADIAFVLCEFGQIPPEIELEAMRRLLDLNFILYRGHSPAFTRDPDSGGVVLMAEIPLSVATAPNVFYYMKSVVEQATEWRKTFFLGAPAPKLPELNGMI